MPAIRAPRRSIRPRARSCVIARTASRPRPASSDPILADACIAVSSHICALSGTGRALMWSTPASARSGGQGRAPRAVPTTEGRRPSASARRPRVSLRSPRSSAAPSRPPRFATIAPRRQRRQTSRVALRHPAFARDGGARYGSPGDADQRGFQTMSDGQARDYGFETLAIHAGAEPDPTTGARAVPIYQTTSYVFDDVDHAAALFNLQKFGNIYSRLTNPTVSVLEERIAALEGGTAACCTASRPRGAVPDLPQPDDARQQRRLLDQALWRLDHPDDATPSRSSAGTRASSTRATRELRGRRSTTGPGRSSSRALPTRTASSPTSRRSPPSPTPHGVPLVVDNTMPTPYLCQPLKWGADIVVHSMTKYLGGQGNSVGGVIVEGGRFDWANGKFPLLTEPTEAYHGLRFFETFGNFGAHRPQQGDRPARHGPCLSPFNAFLILTRASRPCRCAWTATSPMPTRSRPGSRATRTSPGSPIPACRRTARRSLEKYCPRGLGSVFTFGVKGGYEMGVRLVDSCQLLSHVANIGDTRSLIIHPASTTHRQLDEAQLRRRRRRAGRGPPLDRDRDAPATSSPTSTRRSTPPSARPGRALPDRLRRRCGERSGAPSGRRWALRRRCRPPLRTTP